LHRIQFTQAVGMVQQIIGGVVTDLKRLQSLINASLSDFVFRESRRVGPWRLNVKAHRRLSSQVEQ